jgi:hypothetical protein
MSISEGNPPTLLIAINVMAKIRILKVNTNLFAVFGSSLVFIEKPDKYLVMRRSIATAMITIIIK